MMFSKIKFLVIKLQHLYQFQVRAMKLSMTYKRKQCHDAINICESIPEFYEELLIRE